MLNENKERELAYVVKVDDVKPIEGKDRVECAIVGGWTCMVQKNVFKPGDNAVYFEIDSKLDLENPVFAFTGKYNGKIKTQKFSIKDKDGNKIGTFFSQGLLMSLKDLGLGDLPCGTFLTKKLGVTYYDPEDMKRKFNDSDKYKKMENSHRKLFKNRIVKKIYKTKIGKKLIFFIFGNLSTKKDVFPYWVVKTDEERIQNLIYRIPEFQHEPWYATEKRDGTSTTMTLKGHGKKQEYVVCSRNVVMTRNKKGSFYDKNVYVEMSDKYNIKSVLEGLLTDEYDFVTIQGETFGAGIQKRDYGLKEHVFEVFNVIYGKKDGTTIRLNPKEMKCVMDKYDVPTVPIVYEHFMLPSSCEEILDICGGEAAIYGGMREGLVFRNYDATKSFKAVDNEFLTKYHS